MNKFEYLKSIAKPDGGYKVQSKSSPLRYPGGKSRAVGLITQYFPDKLPKKILSTFLGGASMEIAWANNLDVDEVIGCDIFKPLTNFWEVLLSNPSGLANKLSQFQLGDSNYRAYKEILKSWYADPITNKLTDVEAAAHFYYNMQLSYGPLFLGWTNAKYMDDVAGYQRVIERIRSFSCPKLKIKNISFEQALADHPDHFVYADPPYLLGYDSHVFRPMYPNQKGENHVNFKHELFRDLMLARQGDWIISYNDCGTIRKWYDGYEFQFPRWAYTLQQGETRKAGEKGARDSVKESKEILIVKSNYTLLENQSIQSSVIDTNKTTYEQFFTEN
jgi:DNA adenine methylase